MILLFKIMGVAFITLSSAMLGVNRVKSNKDRLNYLEDIQSCMVILENEIRYTQTHLLEIFFKFFKNSDSALQEVFLNTYNLMNEETGCTFKEAWENSIKAKKENFFGEDIELLESFSECFNNFDIEGQLKIIRLYSKKVSYVLNNSKEEYEKNKKLYKSLGIYAGILISVLLI